jgi:hypothetical protein
MEDIENLAAQGKKELILDEDTVLMDLARDMAKHLGIAVVVRSRFTPAKATSPVLPSSPAPATAPAAPAPSSSDAAHVPGARPKGCQHGPLAAPTRLASSNSHQNSDGVVKQLVDLIRKSTGNRSGA